MLAAVVCSTLFLISYLTYHFQVGSIGFKGQGWIRPVYFTILITHTILAAAVVPLVLVDANPRPARALRRAPAHRPLDLSHLACMFRSPVW